MSRKLHPEEERLWRRVVATVRPAPGRVLPDDLRALAGAAHDPKAGPMILPATPKAAPHHRHARPAPDPIEPGRKRRLVRGHDSLEVRIDLHGLDQDRARATLESFLRRAQADGARAALVITGKGVMGDGILRRRAPEWLSSPPLRDLIAGFSPAARHHGGEGALYVALKRPIKG